MAKNKKLWIDCCAGSELKDTQGETLSVEGADISELEQGKGRWNDNHGKGFFNSLGMITEAKKIFKAEDCDNERQSYYWEKIKAPYIYAKGYIYNNEDHPNAKAAAAILKNIHRDDVPLRMKASVEGGVISRGITDPTRLSRTKIHSVALTFTPANNATLVEPLNIDKTNTDWEADKQLIKSVIHLAETDIPSFRHIERHASANTISENIQKIQELAKSLGIDIQVSESTPESIIENAVLSKISSNVQKINNMVKGLPKYNDNQLQPAEIKPVASKPQKILGGTPIRQAADEARTGNIAAQDKYQQDIGKLKSDPVTPAKPLDANSNKASTPLLSGKQLQAQTTLKLHASRAMKDPSYMASLHQGLMSSGRVSAEQAQQIISGIQNHIDETSIKKSNFKKALTAGYGGAGASGSQSGGSVIQTESIDDGRSKTKKAETTDGFSYITCEDCGHDQVYMKHQVKCRNCRQNFSLEKLKNRV
jgi:hypothetical protein